MYKLAHDRRYDRLSPGTVLTMPIEPRDLDLARARAQLPAPPVTEDTAKLAELAASCDSPVLLVSHGGPLQSGAEAIDRTSEGENVGDPGLAKAIADAKIPFGIFGAILGHWLLGMDLMLLSLFGFFGLSGIVINDSIILITFYKELCEKGVSREDAIIDASCQRLRAVLLTSLTTIAGLLPLIFDSSNQAQFLKPMAVSISFGLAFATVLVLIVVPILLSYIETAKYSPGGQKLQALLGQLT